MTTPQNAYTELSELRGISRQAACLQSERRHLTRKPDHEAVCLPFSEVTALQGQVAALLKHIETLIGIAAEAKRAAVHERLRAEVAELRACGERERANKLADEVSSLGRSLADLAVATRGHESNLQDRIDRMTAQVA